MEYLMVLVQKDQTHCVPGSTITDNLFLMRGVSDISLSNHFNLGLFSIDQEKAFDRVGREYLLSVFMSFRVWG